MENEPDQGMSAVVQQAGQEKFQALQLQSKQLPEQFTDELGSIDAGIGSQERLSMDETQFIGGLGWLTALSVTIAAVASNV